MRIIGKYLLKNLFAKPFRTVLLIFCITCCSFVAMLSLDITGNLEKILKSTLSQAFGTSDLLLTDPVGLKTELEIPYANRQLLIYSSQGALVERIDGFYSYFHKNTYQIITMDYDAAYKMRLLQNPLTLASGEAAVSSALAKLAHWSAGDSVTLFDAQNQPVSFRITEILPNYGISNGSLGVYLSQTDYRSLGSGARATMAYIDVLNDNEVTDARKALEEADFNAKVTGILEQNDMQDIIKELGTVLFMVFTVCFLLVIFVAISVSNRIVLERFSVVGTFRSLGISASYCTKLLLAENALYGLFGGCLGIFLYSLVRTVIFQGLIQVDSSNQMDLTLNFQSIPPIAAAGVLVLAMAIMCACPLKEILRTSKTAIRDIIFDNKDTAYQLRRTTTGIGCFCLITAVVLWFLKESSLAQIFCFILLIVAVALLFPWLLTRIAGGLEKLFEKQNMPIARMAAMECFSRKSTVGSSILCVTASSLAIVIFIFFSTLTSLYDLDTYQCDIIAQIADSQEPARFSYIESLEDVTEAELIYNRDVELKINGSKSTVTVFGLNDGGFSLLSAIKNCPAELPPDTFAIDRSLARRMGIKEGDRAEITFDVSSYLPITKTLTLAATVNAYDYDTTGNVIVLPKDLYIDMYHNYPGQLLIRSKAPQRTISQIKTYSGVTITDIQTAEENAQVWKDREKGMRGMISAVIIIGVGLTTIGMISNLLIGFQGRKRECAVLASTAMTREKLSKMFLLESMIASGIALIVALPTAFLAFIPLRQLLENLSTSFDIVYDVKLYILFLAALWCVFTLSALFPIRELRKMNLAAQLKYE